MDYDTMLNEKFQDLEINLVRHDTSPTGYPCFIEVKLLKTPKDKGALVLDLGNYIHRRFGLRYQMTPEYRGKGKATTVRWFMTWDDAKPIVPNVAKALDCTEAVALLKLNSLIIQNTARGVRPRQQEAS